MSATLAKVIFIPIMVFLGWIAISDPVTTYPDGMEEAVQYFSTTVHTITTIFPWAEVPFELVLWAIAIQTVLFVIGLVRWFIELLS